MSTRDNKILLRKKGDDITLDGNKFYCLRIIQEVG